MRRRILTKRICSVFLVTFFIMCSFSSGSAQETIPLWEGKAPGSENWDHQEKTSSFPGGDSIVQNVVNPTMTAYLPDPSIANGAAIIVCPGGAFRMLIWMERGETLPGG